MDLAEPALADIDVGADVQVRTGDRAPTTGVPVIDDQIAAVLRENVGVGAYLDPPAIAAVAHAVVLGDVEAEMLLASQPNGSLSASFTSATRTPGVASCG